MIVLRLAILITLAISAYAEMKNCSVKKSKVDYEVHTRQCCTKVVGYQTCVVAETGLAAWKQSKPVDSISITVQVAGEPIMKMEFSADTMTEEKTKKCVNNMYMNNVCLFVKRVKPKDWRKGGIGLCYTLSMKVHEYSGDKCIYLKGKEFIDLPIKQHMTDLD
uniref:Heteropteran venom family 4 protein 1 n=1 Tax=Ectomocoris sp. TaxID=3104572 RepID=A0AB38ZE96_9HEMI